MPKRINLKPHFSVEELFSFYRQASDPIERTRYQIIWLLAQGRLTEDVAKVTGYCRNSIYRLVRRYNTQGLLGMKDKRHQHPGGQPLLNEIQQAQLLQTLQNPPADGGLWNSRKVADWMSNLLDYPVSILSSLGLFALARVAPKSTSSTIRFKRFLYSRSLEKKLSIRVQLS
ncbi:hypothetical protein NUACC21_02730 [Scytonema sp. NUACC21]